ncbi:MAG: PilZ domain-containing protein [Candidatus Omnitrophica bacterium]|nr:PilZ domain-containing protein [Candidatus Omnitrophota bacterium]
MELSKKTTDVRRFKRVAFHRPIKVKCSGQDVYAGHLTQDISQGGVRVITSDFVPVNSVVTVQVQLKDREKIMELHARVAWVRATAFGETYQLGLEFFGDTPRMSEAIGQFVRSL